MQFIMNVLKQLKLDVSTGFYWNLLALIFKSMKIKQHTEIIVPIKYIALNDLRADKYQILFYIMTGWVIRY